MKLTEENYVKQAAKVMKEGKSGNNFKDSQPSCYDGRYL